VALSRERVKKDSIVAFEASGAKKKALARKAEKEAKMANTSETAQRAVRVLQIVQRVKESVMVKLAAEADLSMLDLARVLGWLEREGKVEVSKNGLGQYVVKLGDGVPTY
jgi:hypothetical protein